MRDLYYILNENKEPVAVDMLQWAEWSGDQTKKIVKQNNFPDGVRVSTVFLGLDHAWGNEIPILFETMIFGGEHDQFQEHYSTWAAAEEGHQRAIELVFSVSNPKG